MSPVGLGTAQLGNLYRETTDEAARATVDAAWDGGIRYFDTAPHYGLGLSERRLGAALSARPRDEYVLSTKVGRLLVPAPELAGQQDEAFAVPADVRREWDFSRDGVLRSVEESLERLGLDRLDVVYVHDPDDHWDQASSEAVPALVELRDQGVVQAVGVGMNQAEMLARFVRETDIDLVMCAGRYTLLEQGALAELMPAALEKGVGVVAAGVFNSGVLASPRPGTDAHYDYAPVPPEVLEKAARIADICELYGVDLPAVALALVRAHPAVVSTVVGARSPEQVTSALARGRTPVPVELWEDLRRDWLIDPMAPFPRTTVPNITL
ncbi:D-threo-aldose 1-dehydrogenase [Sanguibacter antarcticus]|uniref:D-threo-aldose 1-dehydrogenase n=2 Tax=Sanguibacter antarcticus TaxID=372484 RepID=A0A2A9E628_9MICO|nr:D-threo-aldose 1-dehydrogenase [Sanguibacter antarcticus]